MPYYYNSKVGKKELIPANIVSDYVNAKLYVKNADGSYTDTKTGKSASTNDIMQRHISNNKDTISFEPDAGLDYARAIVQGALPGIKPVEGLAALSGNDTLEAMNPYQGKSPAATVLSVGSDVASQAYNAAGGPVVALGKSLLGGATGALGKKIAETAGPAIKSGIESIPDKNIRAGVQNGLDIVSNYALPAWNILNAIPYAKFLPKIAETLGKNNINDYLKDINTAEVAKELYPVTQAPLSRVLSGVERFPYITDQQKAMGAGIGTPNNPVGSPIHLAEMPVDELPVSSPVRYERGNPEDFFNRDLMTSATVAPKVSAEASQRFLSDYINKQNLKQLLSDRDAAQIDAMKAGKESAVGNISNLPVAPYEEGISQLLGMPKSAIAPAVNTLMSEESIEKNRIK